MSPYTDAGMELLDAARRALPDEEVTPMDNAPDTNPDGIKIVPDGTYVAVGDPIIYSPTVYDLARAAYVAGQADEAEFSEWFADQDVAIGNVSDGYHDFDTLYRHRTALFALLCRTRPDLSWRSRQHALGQGAMFEGMFIAGMSLPIGRKIEQITYHLEDETWDWFEGVTVLENAPEWDGHTPDDVLERLNRFWRLNP